MASSSSTNTTSSTTKLQNSYFFYGTHPLKVPNTLVHSTSTTTLSVSATEQNSNHLSLNLTNSTHNNYHHGFSSTISLHDISKSGTDNEANNEVKSKEKKKCFIN
jgi:hypothetical protein